MAKQRLVDLKAEIKDVENDQKAKRDIWVAADQRRHVASVDQRQITKGLSQQPAQTTTNKNEQEQQAANNLRLARKTADTAFLDWLQREEELRTARATRYALQRISTTRPNNDPPSNKANYDARPTWTKLAGEAKTENLYIDCLLDAVLADPTRGIGFDADDPGLCKLDTSITTTLSDVTQSIRQYTVVTKNRFELLAGK